jgi:hypothetical protein
VLSEFDETKRSCRKRLAGHNERRWKLQPNAQNLATLNSRSSSSMHTYAFHMHGATLNSRSSSPMHTYAFHKFGEPNFNLCKEIGLECFQLVLCETEPLGNL